MNFLQRQDVEAVPPRVEACGGSPSSGTHRRQASQIT